MMPSVFVSYFLFQLSMPPVAPVRRLPEIQEEGSALMVQVIGGADLVTSVPAGAQRVPMLKLLLKASCDGEITVTDLHLRRTGLGDRNDILAVYPVLNGERVSSGQVPSRDGRIDLHLRDAVIPSCLSEEMIIYADFSPTASIAAEHRIVLEGSAPVMAGTARVTVQPSGRLFPERRTAGSSQGQITVEYIKLLGSPRYGDGQIVARFTLEADRSDDHRISAITLTNDGTADGKELLNLFLEGNGRRLTLIAPQLNGDRVRLVFDPPLTLSAGQKRLLVLRSDIRMNYKTVRFIVEEPGDIESAVLRGRRS